MSWFTENKNIIVIIRPSDNQLRQLFPPTRNGHINQNRSGVGGNEYLNQNRVDL